MAGGIGYDALEQEMNRLYPNNGAGDPVPGQFLGPSAQQGMSPEEIYQGIYGEPLSSGGLTSRSVKTYAVDEYGSPIVPKTPLPQLATRSAPLSPPTVSNPAQQLAIRNVEGYARSGTGPAGNRLTPGVSAYTDQGAAYPFNYPPNAATAAIDKSVRPLPATSLGRANGRATGGGAGSAPQGGAVDLTYEPMSETSGQNLANSAGIPVRTPSGKVYYPTNGATDKVRAPMNNVSGSMGAKDQRGPLSQLFGLKTSGLGGLLGGLFGGGQQQQGGGLAAMLGGGSSFGSSPSQGQAMMVDPNTSTGSTLESMGFSSGGAVPAATIRNLSERGYI